MLCEIDPAYRHYFAVGAQLPDVMLALRGFHVRTAVRVLGYSRENADAFILKFCGMDVVDGRMVYSDNVAPENRRKLHAYIRGCLKEDVDEELAAAAARE
jgi:hypothetical protein